MQTDYLINGRINACLSPLDRGFAYGDGVFRTLLVRDGEPSCWPMQYRKLRADCTALGLACPDAKVLHAEISTLCSNEITAVAKIVVTRGEGVRGYALSEPSQTNRVVLKAAYPPYPQQYFNVGINLHLCALRLGWQPRLAGIKHLNRLENVLARMEWQDPNIADGLLLDSAGNVIECTMSNVFMRQGSTLLTPDLSRCGVAGITRERILELAPRLGYAAEVRSVGLPELLAADEVVVCNSLIGAWQVRSLGEASWSDGKLAQHLRELLGGIDA